MVKKKGKITYSVAIKKGKSFKKAPVIPLGSKKKRPNLYIVKKKNGKVISSKKL